MQPLAGKTAVVAGATRGAGRGIARALGEAGATVYCSGRSVRGRPATEGRPETIEETAELVTSAGGTGIAVRTDHTRPDEVRALAARVEREQGRVDVLVNDVWGGDSLMAFGKPFWEQRIEDGLAMQERGFTSHLVTAHAFAPLMVRSGRGLVVEVTDGDFDGYHGDLFYDLVKSGVSRLAYALSRALDGTGVTALAVTPGFLRSEAMLDRFGVTESNWRDGAKKDRHFLESETPAYVGRAVAALAADPHVARKAGETLSSGALAREYGFTDADGRAPDFNRYLDALVLEIARRGPRDDEERWLVQVRYRQVERAPGHDDFKGAARRALGLSQAR